TGAGDCAPREQGVNMNHAASRLPANPPRPAALPGLPFRTANISGAPPRGQRGAGRKKPRAPTPASVRLFGELRSELLPAHRRLSRMLQRALWEWGGRRIDGLQELQRFRAIGSAAERVDAAGARAAMRHVLEYFIERCRRAAVQVRRAGEHG